MMKFSMKNVFLLGLIIALVFVSCNPRKNKLTYLCTNIEEEKKAINLTSQELYTSKDLQGKLVRLQGVFSYNFEDIALYPNAQDPHKQGVWLIFDETTLKNDSQLVKLNGKDIVITGIIDSYKGHLGSYFCSLMNIVCIREK